MVLCKQRFFRPTKNTKRQAGALNDYAMSFPEAGEASYLVTPHVVSIRALIPRRTGAKVHHSLFR